MSSTFKPICRRRFVLTEAGVQGFWIARSWRTESRLRIWDSGEQILVVGGHMETHKGVILRPGCWSCTAANEESSKSHDECPESRHDDIGIRNCQPPPASGGHHGPPSQF